MADKAGTGKSGSRPRTDKVQKAQPQQRPARKPSATLEQLDTFFAALSRTKGKGKGQGQVKQLAEQLVDHLGVGSYDEPDEMRRLLTEKLQRPDAAASILRWVAGTTTVPGRPGAPPTKPKPKPRPVPRKETPAPTAVRVRAGNGAAVVSWKPIDPPVREYIVTTSFVDGGKPKVVSRITVDGTRTRALVRDLKNGAGYAFEVHGVTITGRDRVPGRPSRPTTPIVPTGDGPGSVVLLLLDDVPLAELFPSPTTDVARNLLTKAGTLGEKWRYEYLKVLAMRAAGDALQYENHIASLMAMTVSKVCAAEQLLNPVLIEAINRGTSIGQTVAGMADSAPVTDILDSLTSVATDALVLPRFLLWLAETSPIEFWVGLFEAIIEDVASFDTGFSRTGAYCQRILSGDIGGVFGAIQAAVDDALDRLDAEVDAMVAPLRAAVNEIVQGTSQAMAEVFDAFDLPLTAGVGDGLDHVKNVDPLAGLQDELLAKVDALAVDLKAKIAEALGELRNVTTGGAGFTTLVIVYLAVPILAFLVIAIAGGPFSAALLAAAVLLAAQELVHLVLGLLTGPIMQQLDKVLAMARDLTAQLREVLADQATILQTLSPARLLQALATELRLIGEVIPQEFLDAAATLLGEARDAVLSTATDLALAAEQALGMENATAFEAIAPGADTGLPRAPMLPGGADPRRLGGAALLRDLSRLEEQRTALVDGKEIEFTHRLSLFRLLGGQGSPLAPLAAGAFPSFLANGETLVKLTEGDLVDRMFPGVYRALIKDVRVTGVLAAGIGAQAGVTSSIPLTITHLGESRTRVRRTANAAAPPLQFPVCGSGPVLDNLPSLDPSTAGTVTRRLRLEEWLVTPIGPGTDLLPQLGEAFVSAASTAIESALQAVPPGTAAAQGFAIVAALIVAIIFGLPLDEVMADVFDALRRPYTDRINVAVPAAVARAVGEGSCGFVDVAAVKAGVERLLFVFDLENIDFVVTALAWTFQDFDARKDLPVPPAEFATALQPLLNALRAGATTGRGTSPSVAGIVAGAYRVARDAHQHRMARWGRARLEEERDPQVRALGFSTLVRELEPEAAAFNLVSGSAPFPVVGGTGEVLPPAAGLAPQTPSATLQYRPFENRGIEGSFLFRLGDKILPSLPVVGQLPTLTDLLKDIVLDVTVQGCFDPNLAATLRSSQQQNIEGLRAVLPSLPDPMAVVGRLLNDRVTVGPRLAERRTVHFSLRAHREKTRQQWLAVLDSTDALLAPIRTLVGTLLPAGDARVPLGVDQAFAPLGGVIGDATFRFAFSVPPSLPAIPAAADLLALARTLTITRAALGVADVLPGQPGAAGHVCSVGIAVVPMPSGAKPPRPTNAPVTDPLNVRVTLTPKLAPFLGLGSALGEVPMIDRLMMTVVPETVREDGTSEGLPFTPPTLDSLFSSAASLAVRLSGDAVVSHRVYDVIVSISYYVRTLSVTTSHSTVR